MLFDQWLSGVEMLLRTLHLHSIPNDAHEQDQIWLVLSTVVAYTVLSLKINDNTFTTAIYSKSYATADIHMEELGKL